MRNNFRNGYICKKCYDEGMRSASGDPNTPIYRRVNKKFEFAGMVECHRHGITEAVALRGLK